MSKEWVFDLMAGGGVPTGGSMVRITVQPPKNQEPETKWNALEGQEKEWKKVREQWKNMIENVQASPSHFGWQVIWAVIPTLAMARARNISQSVAVRRPVPRSVATVVLDERSGRTNSP